MTDKSPDYIEPVYAWRVWETVVWWDQAEDPPMRKPYLISPMRGTLWPHKEFIDATNGRGSNRVKPSHSWMGVHAAKSLWNLIYLFSKNREMIKFPDYPVVGIVKLWGHIEEHELGYMAQYAYPYKLFVPPYLNRVGEALAKEYGVIIEPVKKYNAFFHWKHRKALKNLPHFPKPKFWRRKRNPIALAVCALDMALMYLNFGVIGGLSGIIGGVFCAIVFMLTLLKS